MLTLDMLQPHLPVPARHAPPPCTDCAARETVIRLLCDEIEALKAERTRLEIELAALLALREGAPV